MYKRQMCPECKKKTIQISLASDYEGAYNCQVCGRLNHHGALGNNVTGTRMPYNFFARELELGILKTPADKWIAYTERLS